MNRYCAFFGSLNVGGNRLTMADLRYAFEREDFANVETVVASGNVLFDFDDRPTDGLEDLFAHMMHDRFDILRRLGEIGVADDDDAVAAAAAAAPVPAAAAAALAVLAETSQNDSGIIGGAGAAPAEAARPVDRVIGMLTEKARTRPQFIKGLTDWQNAKKK